DQQPVAGGGRLELNIDLQRDVHEGTLVIQSSTDATIAIDSRPVGQGHWEGKLPSGGHLLRITANGMRTYQSDVVVEVIQMRRLDIALEPEAKPKGSAAWWWVAGGVVVAGAATGAYFLLKPAKERDATPGTLQPGVTTTAFHFR